MSAISEVALGVWLSRGKMVHGGLCFIELTRHALLVSLGDLFELFSVQ